MLANLSAAWGNQTSLKDLLQESDGETRSSVEAPDEDGEGEKENGVDVEQAARACLLVDARLLLLQSPHLGVRHLMVAGHLLDATDPLAHLLVPRQAVVWSCACHNEKRKAMVRKRRQHSIRLTARGVTK